MIEPIDFGVVNDITTNVPSFNECRSTINVTFIPNRPETWINLKKNIHDILDDPDGYVLCSVNDIIKAKDEILELKELEKDRDMWKRKYGSVITDTFRILSANPFGVKFDFDGFDERGNWLITMDFPELDDAKNKIEKLEKELEETKKDLDATVKNAKFWHDREKEVEKQLEDLKKENQTLRVKAVINSVHGLTSAELERVKSENSELKNKNRDLEKELAESKTFSEVRYEWHPDCFTVIYTKCDGTKETVGMDLAGDTDEKCTMDAFVCRALNIPQCKKCKNHRYFANTGGHYCHLPDSKYMIPGMFHVNPLTEEDAEGPACEKFEARKE